MFTLVVEVCRVSITRIQYWSGLFQLTVFDISSRYFLPISEDEVARAMGHRGDKAEATVLGWAQVNDHVCAVRLQSSSG